MKTNKKRRLGFFGIIVRNFLMFAITIFIMFVIFIVGILVVFIKNPNYHIIPIASGKQYIINGDYGSFDKKILGDDGFFIVLDENNNKIYKSTDLTDLYLSKEQIELIPNIKFENFITRAEYIGQDNKKYISVLFKELKEETNIIVATVIADSNYNIIFSDISKLKKEQLSEFDFNLLTGRYKGKFNISRLTYTGNDGRKYNAIFCRNSAKYYEFFDSFKDISKYISYGFIYIFIIALLIFIIILEKKVKTPLQLLSSSIEEFAEGKSNKPIEYKGPREFEEICKNFNYMKAKLNNAEQEKRKMLADISHDLKTPITVIQCYAKAVLDEKIRNEEQSEYLNTIYNKANSLAELINAFSEYSKIERPDFLLKTSKVNICEFARNYLIEKYNELEFLGFNLDTEICDEDVYCIIDEFQMKRVFENIISNTVKHNPKGTLVLFLLKKLDNKCIIHIGDNGLGIPTGLKENIFKPFSMGDSSRSRGKGSGLGMAIVEKIIKAHGGTIELLKESDAGLSTVFEITLLLADKE
ncbi:HAMP domain-containing sensor histidine kinase [Clostridiaceae bacterium M8S5]|nr:HAMP domain-containing sensor histidine kinase [Clostridiaceae bacterium M8S5]